MTADDIKDRLIDDLEALRNALSDEQSAVEEAIPTLSNQDIVPTLGSIDESRHTSKALEEKDSGIISGHHLAEPPTVLPETTQKDYPAYAASQDKQTKTKPEENNTPEAFDQRAFSQDVSSKNTSLTKIDGISEDLVEEMATQALVEKPLDNHGTQLDETNTEKTAPTEDNYRSNPKTESSVDYESFNDFVPNVVSNPFEMSSDSANLAEITHDNSMNTLFDTITSSHTPEFTTRVEDNPFLPKHLRERLDRSKSGLIEEIARSTDALNASSARLKGYADTEEEEEINEKPAVSFDASTHRQLIDTLVAQYLPIIEQDLRRRLEESLKS